MQFPFQLGICLWQLDSVCIVILWFGVTVVLGKESLVTKINHTCMQMTTVMLHLIL